MKLLFRFMMLWLVGITITMEVMSKEIEWKMNEFNYNLTLLV
ncbi:hypothetical protein [Haloflavibacter putidus]|nr:hypothetical protein [Haloflavibacter putidus]